VTLVSLVSACKSKRNFFHKELYRVPDWLIAMLFAAQACTLKRCWAEMPAFFLKGKYIVA